MDLAYAIIIPLIFIVISSLSKKLARGKGWKPEEDFALGIELSLAAFSSSLIYFPDVIKKSREVIKVTDGTIKNSQAVIKTVQTSTNSHDMILLNVGFVALTFAVFITLLVMQQEQKDNTKVKTRRWIILGLSNFLGLAMFLLFILFIKGK